MPRLRMEGVIMTRMAYTAYPIDLATPDEQFLATVTSVQAELRNAGVSIIFDPGDAFTVKQGSTPGPEIADINNHALSIADGVVAFLPAHQRTVGVPIEIDRAANVGKAVLILTDHPGSWSMQMYNEYENVMVVALADPSSHSVSAAGQEAMRGVRWLASQETQDGVSRDVLPFAPVGVGTPHPLPPTRAYPDDAGIDLYVLGDVTIPANTFVDVPTGVSMELPEGTFGFLTGRSSTFRKHGLLVINGIIDVGYRGELFSAVHNITEADVRLKRGDRISQMIVLPNLTQMLELRAVPMLSDHARGASGFGSSGR